MEEFLSSRVWTEIIEPLLAESIAGVSGRKTNGKYYHGDLTRSWTTTDSHVLERMVGYQRALMDFSNRIISFVDAKKELEARNIAQKISKIEPFINPFLEDEIA